MSLAPPQLGSGVDRSKVPAQNLVLTSLDLSLTGPPNLLQTLQDPSAGVHLVNAAGNPFQLNVFYHSFLASPLQVPRRGSPYM